MSEATLRQRIHDLAMKYHTHPDDPVTAEDVVADLTTILEGDNAEEEAPAASE